MSSSCERMGSAASLLSQAWQAMTLTPEGAVAIGLTARDCVR